MVVMEAVVIRPTNLVRRCFDGLGVLWVGALIGNLVLGNGPVLGLVVAAVAGVAVVIGLNRPSVNASGDLLVSRGAFRTQSWDRRDIRDFVASWGTFFGGSVGLVASDGSSTVLNATKAIGSSRAGRRETEEQHRALARWLAAGIGSS
jgi:hypothetical protein